MKPKEELDKYMNQRKWFQLMCFQEQYRESYRDPNSSLLPITERILQSSPQNGEIGNWKHIHSSGIELVVSSITLALYSGSPKEETNVTYTVVIDREIAFEES